MTLEALLDFCRNITTHSSNGGNSTLGVYQDPGLRDKDRHAILYIVVVLLFYSIGIVIGIITYLKREKEEIEEDKTYEDYMNFRNDPDKWARYFRVQRMICHLNKVEAEQDRKRKAILRKKQLDAEQSLVRNERGESLGRKSKKTGRKKLTVVHQRSNPEVGETTKLVEVVVEGCSELIPSTAASVHEMETNKLSPSFKDCTTNSTFSLDVDTERKTSGRIHSL